MNNNHYAQRVLIQFHKQSTVTRSEKELMIAGILIAAILLIAFVISL